MLDLQAASEWPPDGGAMDAGWYEGLPYPMLDMRPQGFVGRNFAQQSAAVLQVDVDPNRWSDDDVLYALTVLGTDTPGNLIIGDTAYRSWLDVALAPASPIDDSQVAARYTASAEYALRHGVVGSSVGGEFPKFTAERRIGDAVDVSQVTLSSPVMTNPRARNDGPTCSSASILQARSSMVRSARSGPLRRPSTRQVAERF